MTQEQHFWDAIVEAYEDDQDALDLVVRVIEGEETFATVRRNVMNELKGILTDKQFKECEQEVRDNARPDHIVTVQVTDDHEIKTAIAETLNEWDTQQDERITARTTEQRKDTTMTPEQMQARILELEQENAALKAQLAAIDEPEPARDTAPLTYNVATQTKQFIEYFPRIRGIKPDEFADAEHIIEVLTILLSTTEDGQYFMTTQTWAILRALRERIAKSYDVPTTPIEDRLGALPN